MNRSSMAKDVGFTPTPGAPRGRAALAAVLLKFKRIGAEAWRHLRDRKLTVANNNPSPLKEYCVFSALEFYLSPCVKSEANCGIKVLLYMFFEMHQFQSGDRVLRVDLSRAETMPDRSTRCG